MDNGGELLIPYPRGREHPTIETARMPRVALSLMSDSGVCIIVTFRLPDPDQLLTPANRIFARCQHVPTLSRPDRTVRSSKQLFAEFRLFLQVIARMDRASFHRG
jgi:hypothetical protein